MKKEGYTGYRVFPWAEGRGLSWNFLVEPIVVPGLIVSASPRNLLGIQVI